MTCPVVTRNTLRCVQSTGDAYFFKAHDPTSIFLEVHVTPLWIYISLYGFLRWLTFFYCLFSSKYEKNMKYCFTLAKFDRLIFKECDPKRVVKNKKKKVLLIWIISRQRTFYQFLIYWPGKHCFLIYSKGCLYLNLK